MSAQQINLFQDSFRMQEQKFSAQAMIQLGGMVVVATVFFTLLNIWQVSRLEKNVKIIDDRYTTVVTRFKAVNESLAARPHDEALEKEVARMERLIKGRIRVQAMLAKGEFSNTQGFSRYFEAFARQHLNGLWLTDFDIFGAAEHLSLRGRSVKPQLIPRYVQKLANEKSLSGTEFSVFRMGRLDGNSASSSVIEFLISTDELAEDEDRDNPATPG